MKIYILKNEFYKSEEDFPITATEFSTGYDIKTIGEPEVVGELHSVIDGIAYYKSIDYIQYKTGLYVNLEPDTADLDALIFPRSSISKYNLQLANSIGLCDNDYTGEYKIRFNYLFQPEDLLVMNGFIVGKINYNKIYKVGDKIAQLKFSNVIHPKFILTDKLIQTERGSGGFGSTDNKPKRNPIQERFDYINKVEQYNYQKPNITESICEKYSHTFGLGSTTERYTEIISQKEKELNNE